MKYNDYCRKAIGFLDKMKKEIRGLRDTEDLTIGELRILTNAWDIIESSLEILEEKYGVEEKED